jgi:hypothetical protein
MKVGNIVRINRSFLNEPEGCLGFVYENYQDFDDSSKEGASIITENGVNLGGFSFTEQKIYLEFVEDTGVMYEFKNVIQLDQDFNFHIKLLFSKKS